MSYGSYSDVKQHSKLEWMIKMFLMAKEYRSTTRLQITRCFTIHHTAPHRITLHHKEYRSPTRLRITHLRIFFPLSTSSVILVMFLCHLPPSSCLVQCVAVCCSVVQCVAVWCSVVQCVAVWCSVLQYVAVWCSVVQCVAVCCSVLQCGAVCCSLVQCGAVCCSVVQCDAV